MEVSFQGFGEQVATFTAAEVAAGDLVKLSASGTVTACAEGDLPCGVALSVREGYAAVQLGGYAVLKASGSVPVGWQALAAAGKDSVKTLEGGLVKLVLESGDGVVGVLL